jgi:hypothetical protein
MSSTTPERTHHFRLDYDWKDMEWVDLQSHSFAGAISLDELEAICRRIGFEIERQGDIVHVFRYGKML